ncbi:hypothetical protein GGR56DRAFT_666432 [Xylariaceae sp. FL0804]|nr:hypothetical protein GGR56DRAFT_666432 [Xylariaceae sp. FL0804]
MPEEPRKRRRPAKNCEPCRLRKIKCDRGLPCRRCKRSRAALLCTYKDEDGPPGLILPETSGMDMDADFGDNSLQTAPLTEGNVSPSSQGQPGHRVSVAHEEPSRVGSTRAPIRPAAVANEPDDSHASEIEALRDHIARVEEQLAALSSRNQTRTDKTSGLSLILPRPYIRTEQEKTRLFGQCHWVHSLEQFRLLAGMRAKPYALVDTNQTEIVGQFKKLASARQAAKSRQPGRLQDPMPSLADTVPPKAVCDCALECYLRTFEPMLRILHVPSFMCDYQAYWSESPSQSQSRPESQPLPRSFLMKLVMVVSLGGIFLADRAASSELRQLTREWIHVVQWWLVGPTEREAMSIDGVQVFCLLVLSRQANSLGGAASVLTDALLKLALTVGLHVDSEACAVISAFENEMRRRLWTTVLELVTMVSLNASLPLLISPDDFHPRVPSNICDVDLKPDSDAGPDAAPSPAPPPPSGSTDVDCSLQILLSKSLRLRMRIVRLLNNDSKELNYPQCLELGNTLKLHCREISAFFQAARPLQSRAAGHHNQPQQPLLGYHQKFMDGYMRRVVLFLHRPFAIKARRNPQFFLARKVCLESAMVLASYAEESMDLPLPAQDDYTYMCMRGGGLFKGALSQDVVCALSSEVMVQMDEDGSLGLGGSSSNTRAAADPLTVLSRSGREPVVRALQHLHQQWRQIILLGRPSLMCYILLSIALRQISCLESGRDPRASARDFFKSILEDCTQLLRESAAACGDASSSTAGWTEDTASPFSAHAMELFGFDFKTFEPILSSDMPDFSSSFGFPINDDRLLESVQTQGDFYGVDRVQAP